MDSVAQAKFVASLFGRRITEFIERPLLTSKYFSRHNLRRSFGGVAAG
jgi:hypothetical protein